MSVTRIRSGAEIFPPDSKRPQDSLYYYPEEFCFLAQIVREDHRKSRKPSRLRPWPSSIFYLPSSRLRRQPRWVLCVLCGLIGEEFCLAPLPGPNLPSIPVALNPVGNPAVNLGRGDLPTRFETSTGFTVLLSRRILFSCANCP